ncbi:hypothetical protein [Butyrivibrio proteoclasticus]|uniref:hypothetical protein n=1 Tax=Butyrivibrio proteoclasticus TaxID=43305 RepID=UPI0004788796|nr:hypothetical protein [Butyrivibrio proteoclasticus]
MKRAQKTALISMIETMQEAVKELNKRLKMSDTAGLPNLLADLQDTAVMVGETIEAEIGQGSKSAALLEKLCEEAYKVSNEMSPDNALNDILVQAKDSIDAEIHAPATVVFLPIDASMWDGFGTIWEKEISNPDNKVIVIPLPWYERDGSGAPSVLHYEKDGYPEKVETTGYNDYLIKNNHPDVVYIQSISNGNDLGKTVHPAFYTSELKDNTDDLIYIPYTLEGEIDLKNESQLARLTEKVMLPGIFDVNTVILQSQNLKEAYIEVLTKDIPPGNEEELAEKRDYWDSVIKTYGSPRIERILRLNKEDIPLPEEWKRFVEKPDGSRKKIVLYSNSGWTFMEDCDGLIDKIRDSFKVFEENAEAIALIWRPYPRIKEILGLLRPDCLKEYEALVQEFKDKELGILDEDSDFTRSVVLSDAYYGDDGGMVSVYRATGKPVMVENISVRSS